MDPELAIPYWDLTHLAPCVIMGFSCLLGVPGNIAALIALGRYPVKGNFTLRLMLNLALCDLLALLCLPLAIHNLQREWTLGPVVCKLTFFILNSSLNASVFTITLLSVQRYVQVLYPQSWAQLGRIGEEALLMALWGLAGVVASSSFSEREIEENGSNQLSCSTHYHSNTSKLVVLLLQTLMGFVAPCSIMVTSYFFLHRRVSKTSLIRQRRLAKMVTSIVVSFFSFWTPVHLFNLVSLANMVFEDRSVECVCNVAWDFLIALTTINSCLNPFLYTFASSGFRRDPYHITRI